MTTRSTTADGPYQVMPPLAEDEYAALRDAIARYGVLTPIVKDHHGNILDGHHRKRIADELGVKYRVDVIKVEDEDEARALAYQYNVPKRHLTREQKRQLIHNELDRDPDRSDREIARLVGVDHKTVGTVRREREGGEFPTLTESEAAELARLESDIRSGLATIADMAAKWDTFPLKIRKAVSLKTITWPDGPDPDLTMAMDAYGIHTIHPALNSLPMVTHAEQAAITDSVLRHGLIQPITLDHTGTMLIDGRIRLLACYKSHTDPVFNRLPESADHGEFLTHIISANLIRANYSEDQRAMIAVKTDALRREYANRTTP